MLVFSEDYNPSQLDVTKTRIRTTGLVEAKYEINNVCFHIWDMGGTRNERRKWICSFENVSCVIFTAALNHYDSVLFEDESRNAMLESIQLFDEIVNSKWFKRTEFVLFLTKLDTFKALLRNGVSLSKCFNEENGWNGLQWNDDDMYYRNGKDEVKDDEIFEQCCEVAIDFIRDIYVSCNRNNFKRVFVHVVDATNKTQVERVFWDVQNIVIRSNLRKGLIWDY